MKTKPTAQKSPSGKKESKIPRRKSSAPRKSIDNRGLNKDEDQTTNAYREEDWDITKETDVTLPSDRSVEDEEDREKKRRIEDANPAEDVF